VAAEHGDADAGKALLYAAALSLDALVDGAAPEVADIGALKFLRDGLREHLCNAVPIDRALCIDRAVGAPRARLHTAIGYYLSVALVLDRQRANKLTLDVNSALEEVRKRHLCSKGKIKAAWQAAGGLKYYIASRKTK
jgi:hypothetical protein